jgi:hypothetical protein
MTTATPDPVIEPVLKRYLQIQQEEQRLKEEKGRLQEALANHLGQRQLSVWNPNLNGQLLKVRHQTHVTVKYDEALLQSRLKDHYTTLLAPDIRKIKLHLAELGDALSPVLSLVGSPHPDKVRSAIENGSVPKEAFTGAFTKTSRHIVSVAKMRAES